MHWSRYTGSGAHRKYERKLGKAKIGSASISFETIEDVDYHNLTDLVIRAGELSP